MDIKRKLPDFMYGFEYSMYVFGLWRNLMSLDYKATPHPEAFKATFWVFLAHGV